MFILCIYIYIWYAVYCCMLLVDLCGCWLIQMSGAMEFLHVLVQWWVFPLSRQSSTNHWNQETMKLELYRIPQRCFFAADLAQKFWGSSVNNLLLPENAQKLKDSVEGRGDRISCKRLYWTHYHYSRSTYGWFAGFFHNVLQMWSASNMHDCSSQHLLYCSWSWRK